MNQLTPIGAPAPTLFDLWRGITANLDKISPFLTGTIRGLVEVALLAALAAGMDYFNVLIEDFPTWAWIAAPTFVQGSNMVRGWIDQIDPRKKRLLGQ